MAFINGESPTSNLSPNLLLNNADQNFEQKMLGIKFFALVIA